MVNFTIENEEYLPDLLELIRFFEPRMSEDIDIHIDYSSRQRDFVVKVSSTSLSNFVKTYAYPFDVDKDDLLEVKRTEKRYLKMALYYTLSFLTGIRLPYGCLTGVRPTKLYCEIQNSFDKYLKSAHDVFTKDYDVSDKKIALIEHTVNTQSPLRNKRDKDFDVFVFIPFCPTRCAYCSFVSLSIEKQKKLVEPYVDCLIKELEQTHRTIKEKGLNIRATYIGGGTPTSIGANLLDKVLEHCHFGASEFTVEAGRPDTINQEIVDVMLKHGVTRVSVNPQTFNDKTLQLIGRKHKSQDTYNAYMMVRDKFDVNMDLIAMLPGESFEDFKRSIDIAVALNPANITVHTLYMKKGSQLTLAGYDNNSLDCAVNMVDYAYDKLTSSGYNPYYMYRQKYTSGNLENVGYAKQGKECIYNIDIMEEDTSILANGANGISKKWDKDKMLITRCGNYKDPLEYIKNIDKMLSRQYDFWHDDNQDIKDNE